MPLSRAIGNIIHVSNLWFDSRGDISFFLFYKDDYNKICLSQETDDRRTHISIKSTKIMLLHLHYT
jgi:hypothetical protein